MQEVALFLSFLRRHLVLKACLSEGIQNGHLERLAGHTYETEVLIPSFIDQRVRMQGGTRCRGTTVVCRQRPTDEFVKIRRPVLIRIIEVGLDPMDVPAQKDHVGKPLLEDSIDNDLTFAFEQG